MIRGQISRREAIHWLAAGAAATFLPVGCRRAQTIDAPLVQRSYLWQRDWNRAVSQALAEAERRIDGLVVLAGEIIWPNGIAKPLRVAINWSALRQLRMPISLALRVAPFSGPFSATDASGLALGRMVASLLSEARQHGLELVELQIDFDCAQSKLSGYRVWVEALASMVRPLRFVITTLPSWLKEPTFEPLVRVVDGYVLQVHSVPTTGAGGKATLCNSDLARKWVAQAAELGRPFSVALPTYRCAAGYDAEGKLLGVAMDAVQPAWPAGTSVLAFATNADEVAGLVREWNQSRPAGLRELLWYRLPVATDTRNWRWPTLAAVMSGRSPTRGFTVRQENDNPADLWIENTGESDDESLFEVVVSWENAVLTSADALPGWTVQVSPGRAKFSPADGVRLRLSPGDKRGIGWLRHDSIALLHSQVVVQDGTNR